MRAACIMERAGNDSAGKIADTRDGRDLQPDYSFPSLSLSLSLLLSPPTHPAVEQCFPIYYTAAESFGTRSDVVGARNCVTSGEENGAFLSLSPLYYHFFPQTVAYFIGARKSRYASLNCFRRMLKILIFLNQLLVIRGKRIQTRQTAATKLQNRHPSRSRSIKERVQGTAIWETLT